MNIIPVGSWEYIWNHSNSNITILATGSMVSMVLDGKEYLSQNIKGDISLINCRFIKPFDEDKLKAILDKGGHVITIEEGSLIGGLGSVVNDYFNGSSTKVVSMGIPDEYIEHGTRQELLDDVGLNIKGVLKSIKAIFNE